MSTHVSSSLMEEASDARTTKLKREYALEESRVNGPKFKKFATLSRTLHDRNIHFNALIWLFIEPFVGTGSSKPYTYIQASWLGKSGAFGNHEFVSGIDSLLHFLRNVTFPVLSANIDAQNVPEMQGMYQKSMVLNVNGEQIGIVGYVFRYTPLVSNPGTPPSTEQPDGVYPTVLRRRGSNVLIVTDFMFAKYLGYLQVTFDEAGELTSWGGNPILLDENVTQDSGILTEMQPWKQRVVDLGQTKIGTTLVELNDVISCRRNECSLGNLIADALVYKYLKPNDGTRWTNASIGMWNSGGIREPIEIGDILVSNVLRTIPFENTVDIVKINGSTLWAVMEHSVSLQESNTGRFLQVSGLRVVYDLSKPVGRRVVSIDVRCADCTVPEFQPLVKTKSYDVVTNTYLLEGGDGFSIFKDNILYRYGIEDLDADVVMSYITQYSPIIHGLEGRIRYVSDIRCNFKKTPPRRPVNVPTPPAP
ncbi:5'-nucleotidase-like [Lingula anatina]|uniref:5'-nucleotidase n=1 Tax=Lingula anatina TaxID=7574 RepID=A0A1S3K7D9_LINAN|nr:5'-nucleotidase-like [Lingula anatina]|eukprot:XP_013418359.1 5'-nucleotidase-like [Lingula anatina]